jgi:hypothetical protein
MSKRIADILEKIGAGSMLIGLFQNNNDAVICGLILLAIVLIIERRLQK